MSDWFTYGKLCEATITGHDEDATGGGPAHAAFVAAIPNPLERVDFENRCLSIGREFMPAAAVVVLEGGQATEAYWSWLMDQIEEL